MRLEENIVWSGDAGFSSGDIFMGNALSASTLVTLGPTYDTESFEIIWPAGVWDLEVRYGNCSVYSESIEIITPPSLDDIQIDNQIIGAGTYFIS